MNLRKYLTKMWTVHTFEVNKILFSGNVIHVDARVVSGGSKPAPQARIRAIRVEAEIILIGI